MSMEVLMKDNILENKSYWNFQGKVDYVDEWSLMGSPIPLILITIAYFLFVLKLGPEYMKNKSALNLKNILTLYNVFQIGFSCYLFYRGSKLLWPYGIVNSSCLVEGKGEAYILTSGIYIYFIAKLTELLDTIFFVLKKNNRQITFLHVYHHSSIIWNSWMTLKYEPTYHVIFFGTLNAFVHIIMYSYYSMSVFPALHKFLWWKKYITELQIIQFILVILHTGVNYWFSVCPLSSPLRTTILLNSVMFVGLFTKFYYDSYKKSQNKKLKE